jgi:hypothetical protein
MRVPARRERRPQPEGDPVTEAAFEPVSSRVDLVAQEERMLEFWREHDVMSK